ncbi:MAG: beta-lactamase family protein, partial [Gemmatimonadales bacterium]|nr:beta-lactamase family protein [Gemmatimonadales bacterium]
KPAPKPVRKVAAAAARKPAARPERAAKPGRYARVDAAVRAGIRRGLYPGAVVIIGRHDKVLYQQGYGTFTWSRKSRRPDPRATLWDLASVSKVVGTMGAAIRLVDQGLLDLDAPVAHYLPAFSGGDKDRVTVRMLLDHTSGLRPFLPFYRTAASRDEAVSQLLADPLRRPPGLLPEYSDLNAILLGLVLERAAGESLDSLVAHQVTDPLRMRQTFYRPEPALLTRIAPSSSYKRQPIAGIPNDQNAVVLGGAAGHAGLFSTGRDLALFAQAWLNAGTVRGGPWVSRETMRLFLTPGANSGTRLLGWESPDPAADGPTAFGDLLSSSAFGHTGWTGTQIWIDPSRDLYLIFLTNRSFDPRRARSIAELRGVRSHVSDAVARLAPERCTLQITPC